MKIDINTLDGTEKHITIVGVRYTNCRICTTKYIKVILIVHFIIGFEYLIDPLENTKISR